MSKKGKSSSSNSISSNASATASLSSAEMQTLEAAEEDFDDAEEQVRLGVRLYPLGKCFTKVDFLDTKDEYLFGKHRSCDICYNGPEKSRNPAWYQTLSKIHFRIYKESKDNCNFYFIEDKSLNGTFVNGDKIGKGNKQVLKNNDEIALSNSKNKAYVFMDTSGSDQSNLPVAIREKFIMYKVLGRGAFGQVKLAFEKRTCRKVAVKIIEKKTFSTGGTTIRNTEKTVMEEVRILKRLHHPCIIGIEDVFDTPEVLYMVQELAEGGDLSVKLASLSKFDEATAKFYFYQIITACKYLHDNRITHRDLKPENLLLMTGDTETILKVADFGLSKFVGKQSLMKTQCGTPLYLAPEILTSMAKDMVKKLLTLDPRLRLTMEQALADRWLQDHEVIDKAEKVMYPNENEQMFPPTAPVPGTKRLRDSAMSTDDEHNNDPGISIMSSRKMSRIDDSGDDAFDKRDDVSKVAASGDA